MLEQLMQQALDLARKGEGRTSPNPPVGAVVVSGSEIIGRGFHPLAGEPHAEVFALQEAGVRACAADLYVTLEPCNHRGRTGPCTEAIIESGIRRVIVGCLDPNPLVSGKGVKRLRDQGIDVVTGVLEADCRRLIAPFAKQLETGSPFVTLKTAMTLDGRTATRSGDSQWISNAESRLIVHRMRDRVDAVMTGIGSILADDSLLTTRLPEGGRDALRIVVDSKLRIPDSARILSDEAESLPLLITTANADKSRIEQLRQRGVEVFVADSDDSGRVALAPLMKHLGERNIQHLLLEAGAELNAAALAAGIIDRVAFFIAPKIIGGDQGRSVFSGAGVNLLKDAVELQDVRWQQVGDNLLIEGEVA